MEKKVLVILADGFEEIEAVTPIDILRRAGVLVTVAGLHGAQAVSARGLRIVCDVTLSEVLSRSDEYDACVLPGGGKGAENLASSRELGTLVTRMDQAGKLVAAICASPAVVLAPLGILDGKRATCFPGLQDRFRPGTEYSEEAVVEDDDVITSRAAGTSALFALAVVRRLCGEEVRAKIARAMLYEQPV